MKLIIVVALSVLGGYAQAGNMLLSDHPLAGKIWDAGSRAYMNEKALLARINATDVLLLGETHDNPLHHMNQLKLLQARTESGARSALMMEQLNAEEQRELDQALSGSNREEALDKVMELVRFKNGEPYRDLLSYAVNNQMRIIAANVSSKRLQPAIWYGYSSYDEGEIKRLAVEEVWNEERQRYLVNHMGGAHCGELREELRLGLSRSQRLRDAMMADSAIPSIERGVVAIVGRSHARRDIGLPLYFAARAPSARILSIGFIEVAAGKASPDEYEASATGELAHDIIWFTPQAERPDPCADFGKAKEAQP